MVKTDNATGMGYLIGQAKPDPKSISKVVPEKCLKLRCILEGIDYYTELGDGRIKVLDEPPYFPSFVSVCYSVLKEGAKVIQIFKHTNKRFFQTGITTEECDLPEWWARKDEN